MSKSCRKYMVIGRDKSGCAIVVRTHEKDRGGEQSNESTQNGMKR